MSRASEWVKHYSSRPRLSIGTVQFELTSEGKLSVCTSTARELEPLEALKLRDWLTATFEDTPEAAP